MNKQNQIQDAWMDRPPVPVAKTDGIKTIARFKGVNITEDGLRWAKNAAGKIKVPQVRDGKKLSEWAKERLMKRFSLRHGSTRMELYHTLLIHIESTELDLMRPAVENVEVKFETVGDETASDRKNTFIIEREQTFKYLQKSQRTERIPVIREAVEKFILEEFGDPVKDKDGKVQTYGTGAGGKRFLIFDQGRGHLMLSDFYAGQYE